MIINKEFLLLNLKNLDVAMEQTQAEPQETTEFKLEKAMETFSFMFF